MIPFSPPDITQAEIDEVVDTLKSGWITTGPKTKLLEERLAAFCGTGRVACLNSATAALECGLRLLGVGPGDQVITSAYTYTATAAAICHVGAEPVLVDVAPGTFEMDYAALPALVTERTRAVIPVDVGGRMVDYDALFAALEEARPRWRPAAPVQEACGRIPVLADAAHSLGAVRNGARSGQVADFTAFSFHAVKNLTTAEGGALTWRPGAFGDDALYRRTMLLSLHGQDKDALAKSKAGSWEYDIAFPGWKCNMTDIQAALGLAQLDRYPGLLARRRQLVERYEANLAGLPVTWLRHFQGDPQAGGFASSAHLMLVRLSRRSRAYRDQLVERMGQAGVAVNVHYKPLPLLSAYREMGFRIEDFPNALAQFQNEVTLPLHTLLSDADVDTVCEALGACMADLDAGGCA